MLVAAQIIAALLGIYGLCVIAWLILTTLISFNVVNRSQRFVMLAQYYLNRLCGPPLRHIRRHLPNTGQLDLSPIALLMLLTFAQDLVLALGAGLNPLFPIITFVLSIIQLIIYALIAQMILSFLIGFNIINRYQRFVSALSYALDQLLNPLLTPIRSFLPPLGNLDFSGLILIILLGLLKNALLQFLFHT